MKQTTAGNWKAEEQCWTDPSRKVKKLSARQPRKVLSGYELLEVHGPADGVLDSVHYGFIQAATQID
jgi:hypothetical protein